MFHQDYVDLRSLIITEYVALLAQAESVEGRGASHLVSYWEYICRRTFSCAPRGRHRHPRFARNNIESNGIFHWLNVISIWILFATLGWSLCTPDRFYFTFFQIFNNSFLCLRFLAPKKCITVLLQAMLCFC